MTTRKYGIRSAFCGILADCPCLVNLPESQKSRANNYDDKAHFDEEDENFELRCVSSKKLDVRMSETGTSSSADFLLILLFGGILRVKF